MTESTTASTAAAIPPLIHAVGGSAGSALALLLLYPLERARMETQKVLLDHTKVSSEITTGGFFISNNNNKDRPTRLSRESNELDDAPTSSSWEMASAASSLDTSDFQDAVSEAQVEESLVRCIHKLWTRNELYRGVTPLVLTLATSNFVFFYVNEFMKKELNTVRASRPLQSSSSTISLIASTLAGICNVILTNPLWVANLRIVTGESHSQRLLPELWNIAKTHGLAHLWHGTGASLLLVSNPVIQFFLYEEFKTVRDGCLTPVQAFVGGAAAKLVATVVTYPLQLTQNLLRMQEDDEYAGTWDCLTKVYKSDKMAGLFAGMRAKLLQTVLTAAFTFLTYEQIITVLHAATLKAPKQQNRGIGVSVQSR
jgi:solute carrier family 25 (peroxisomal adenine nucleotide transporter), member 17